MATLVGNAKYGPGHKIVLKESDKIPTTSKSKFSAFGYKPGVSVFELTKINKTTKVNNLVDLGTGKESIYLKDDKNKIVAVMGSASSINGTFNHFSENAKSNTGTLTRIKEEISMRVFEAYYENKKLLTEDQVIQSLSITDKKLYDSIYYTSAIKQLNELKKYVKKGGYTYERQGQDKTKYLYEVARKVSGLANDNWNPADVWMIDKKITDLKTVIGKVEDIGQINQVIASAWKKGQIIPISLKQVTDTKAKSEVVDPANLAKQKLDIDLSFAKVDLSDTYNNFIISTESGFAARVGFKASASTLNVSIEGRMIGAGYQMGAVDAKKYAEHCKREYGYNVRSGVNVTNSDMLLAQVELKEIFNKYPRISNTIETYDQAIKLFVKGNNLTKERFSNLISYLYSFLMAPQKKFKNHMQYCYFSSKKMSSDGCLYLLLK